MTIAQKSKETREGMKNGWDQSSFCISSQQSLHIRTLLHYNLKLPNVYVGIVGWIYRTKIDPISILPFPSFHSSYLPFFLIFLSNGHPYIFFISLKCFSLVLNVGLVCTFTYSFCEQTSTFNNNPYITASMSVVLGLGSDVGKAA